ncbi:MAG: tetratricopeptide repeat protein [Verrucomicrobia bacterium]|nr:tetratricopeptide repeat protein [Verrucomicrobiota bacterium]MBI3868799.1 tetratricopeptide repeat protein [Verrucomicrobiota bacterium]
MKPTKRLFALTLASCLAVMTTPARGSNDAPHAGDAPSSSSAPRPASSAESSRSSAQDLIPSSGFLTPLSAAAEPNSVRQPLEKAERFREQLEAGRKRRQMRDLDAARNTLIPILEGDAPADVQEAALLELGLIAEEQREFSRAQQIYNQFLKRFGESDIGPEVLLRQGLMYREMGAPTLAMAKFYAVGSTALKLKEGNIARYRRVVLQAQTEIANTYYLQGKYEDAVEFLQRLMKQETVDLHRSKIQYKIVQCRDRLRQDHEMEADAREFLRLYSNAPESPEVRFLLANALKRTGRNRDSLQEISQLLISQEAVGKTNAAAWAYWQQRAGNEIGNQLYQEGDYVNALTVYEGLLPLDRSLDWQGPLLYQVGLIYEKLAQPPKASLAYSNLVLLAQEAAAPVSAGLRSLVDMAKWRLDQVQWESRAQRTNAFFATTVPPAKTTPAKQP